MGGGGGGGRMGGKGVFRGGGGGMGGKGVFRGGGAEGAKAPPSDTKMNITILK